ncbi:MAG: thioredoxin domain-containing protein [Patescibacteria group bacterium]
MENKNILWGIIGTVVIFGFLTIVYMATNSTGPAKVFEHTKTLDKTDHITWSPAKKHILTEYGDYQCPACGTFHQFIKGTIEKDTKITNNITFVYRNYPLTNIHNHALEAAYAAEAAGIQGKYFEMGDKLYDTQAIWEKQKNVTSLFEGYAKDLKLDLEKFKADMKSSTVKNKVEKDSESGNKAQVNSTPSFYLDGAKVDVISLDQFKTLLDKTAQQ